MIEERSVIDGSEGSGERTGTPGHRVQIRRLPGSGASIDIFVHPDRVRFPAQGLFGGGPGSLTRLLLNDRELTAGGELETSIISITSDDDRFISEAASGGGFGAAKGD